MSLRPGVRSEVRTALVVIARDEAPRLRRLLDSVAPWVDRMLVLDTGSVDDTVSVARAAGAVVHRFDWCDDFSAARNRALALAGADWHIVLDADEWLIDGGPALADLRHASPDFVGAVRLDDFGSADGVVRHWLSRVLPGPTRYGGRIHEQPQHRLPVRQLPVTVGHDGYLPDRLLAKQGRNRRLLEAAVQAAPADAYLWYQLGKDQSVYGEHAQAAASFERAEALPPPGGDWRADACARHLYALKKTGRHAEAVLLAQRHLGDFASSTDFFFALGDVLLDWCAESPSRAAELLPMAMQAWQSCLDLGEQPQRPGSVQGRGSHLAAHNLAVVHEGLGQFESAAALRSRYPMPQTGRQVATGDRGQT